MVEKRWNEYITLKGDYVDEWGRILSKSCFFISHSTNLLSDVLVERLCQFGRTVPLN